MKLDYYKYGIKFRMICSEPHIKGMPYKLVALSDIKIPDRYNDAHISEIKIKRRFQLLEKNVASPIVIDDDNVLVDGYIVYLCLLKLEFDLITVFVSHVPEFYLLLRPSYRPKSTISLTKLIEKYGNKCYICGRKVVRYLYEPKLLNVDKYKDMPPDTATRDHIIPISLGGEDTMENTRVCCARCNSIKQNFLLNQRLKEEVKRVSLSGGTSKDFYEDNKIELEELFNKWSKERE